MRRVLITRPEPGATRTARRLATLGFAPLLLPLFETHSLFVDSASIPDDVGAVAATSANAIRHAPRPVVAALARTVCFAVGEKTAAAARDAGFLHVVEGAGDADGLARAVVAAGPAGPLVYLCGRVRRPVFEDMLAAAGIAVKAIEVYDMVKVECPPGADGSVLGGLPVDATLLYSAAAAEAFLDFLGRPELAQLFEDTEFLCISARVADAVGGKVRGKIRIAAEPTEEALLSLLGETG